MTSDHPLSISVVMPAYKAEHLLPRVLPPLIDMLNTDQVQEVLVVDDQSPDDTAALAREMGATVLTTPVNGGPGAARNLAAKQAKGDVLWFVDSDVIAWPDGPEHIRRAMSEDNVGAVFGSYDDAPDGQAWFSRYKNLLHRYHHQRARREARTFWAGCGAIRRDVFNEVGGFDVKTYEVPSIEDIELGYRIAETGRRILVEPQLQGKHLKVWTIRNSLTTDIHCRALPWARLMISREGLTDDLNTSMAERVRAGIAGLLLLSILALPFWPGSWPLPLILLMAAFVFGGIIAFNRPLDQVTAEAIIERQFVEVIVAPTVDAGAAEAVATKKNVRLLETGPWPGEAEPGFDFKKVSGGLLVQDTDRGIITADDLRIVTEKKPTQAQIDDLLFAWTVVKYVKSNAIVFCKEHMTVGIGAGQMSRVYSTKIAAIKAADEGLEVKGSVMASDAFFPFRDGIDAAAEHGIAAIIQPGGSMRDDEVIAAANEHGLAMVFTGMRHFRH